jgi:hypothetical protein
LALVQKLYGNGRFAAGRTSDVKNTAKSNLIPARG